MENQYNDTYPEYDAVYVQLPNPYDAFPYQSENLRETTELSAAYRDLKESPCFYCAD